MSEKKVKDVMDIGELLQEKLGRPLRELEGKVITIEDFVELQGRRGPFVIMKTREHGDVYTFSKVVIAQLKQIEEWFNKGIAVRAKVVKEKRYWRLTNP